MTKGEAIKEGTALLKKVSGRMKGTPIYAVVAGSHSFGLARENSDCDLKGVYTAPIKSILGFGFLSAQDHTTSTHTDKSDYELHELWKFIKLLMKCNPTIMEIAYVDEQWVLHQDEVGRALRQLAPAALHSGHDPERGKTWGIWSSFFGYSTDQIQKGCKKTLGRALDERPSLSGAIPLIRNSVDAVLEIYGDDTPDGQRKALREHLDRNYDFKFFSHTLRLLSSGIHCLETGEFVVVPPCRDLCMSILTGQTPLGEVMEHYAALAAQHEGLKAENALPDDPDREAFEEFLISVRLDHVREYLAIIDKKSA